MEKCFQDFVAQPKPAHSRRYTLQLMGSYNVSLVLSGYVHLLYDTKINSPLEGTLFYLVRNPSHKKKFLDIHFR